MQTSNKYKWLKVAGSIIGIIIMVLIGIILWLQTTSGNKFIKTKATSYLQNKIGTPVTIDKLTLGFSGEIKLNGVLFIDKQKDTLLSGDLLQVNISLLKLISGNIAIQNIVLNKVRLNINRKAKDSTYNFQYIVDAFASKNKDTITVAKSIALSIDKIAFNSVLVNYNDAYNQLFSKAFIGNLQSNIGSINLDSMRFVVKDFTLKNSSVWVQDKSINTKKNIDTLPQKATPFNLLLSNFDIKQLKVNYSSTSSKIDYSNLIDTLQLQNANLDLLKEQFSANAVIINNSAFSLTTNDTSISKKDTSINITDLASKKGWQVDIETIQLSKNNVAINNNAYKPIPNQIDYNHLTINNLSLQSDFVHYNGNNINATIVSATALLNNILLQSIKGKVALDEKEMSVKNLQLLTKNSLINADGKIIFNSTNKQAFVSESSAIEIALDTSYLGVNDLLFFIPVHTRSLPFALRPGQKILLQTKANGTFKNLDISKLDVKTNDNRMVLNAKGKIKNALDTKQLKYDIVVNKLYVDKNMLSITLLAQLKKSNINLPNNVLVNGTATGGINNVNAKLQLNSPFGFASINGTVSNFSDTKNIQYNVAIIGNNLQTGKWINQDSLLGLFTGNVSIKGSGTDYKQANIQSTATIKSFTVKGYNYNNVNINAAINKGAFTTKGNIKDENLVTTLDLKGTIGSKYPTVKGTIVVDKADLQKLHFATDSINIRSTIFIDAQDLNPKNLNATLLLDSSIITYNGKRLFADSISIKGNTAYDSTKLFVSAPFVQASMIGKYDYEHLPTAINAFIQHNYLQQNTDTLKVIDQQMVLNATITLDSIVKQMLPSLVMEKPAVIYASFNNAKQDTSLNISAKIPSILYNTLAVGNVNLNANGLDSNLNFKLGTDYVIAGGKKLYNAGVVGNLADKALSVTVKTDDAKQKKFYAISAIIEVLKDETKIHLSDSLLLNYEKWNVAKDNTIQIKKEGYIVTNFAIDKDKQTILIANKEATTASPILFKIDNFNVGDVLAIANQDSSMASGIVNVDATIDQPITGLPKIVGNASITDLSFQKVPIGNVAINTTINNNQSIDIKGGITGANNLTIDGGYNINDQNFAISSKIQQLNVKAIEAFSQGQITRSSGNVRGNIYVNGTVSDPRWKGELVFDSVQLATAMFGSLYKINNQKLDFEYPNIGLRNFTITDSLNNKVVINGTVKNQSSKAFALDLTVNARNFIAINQPRTPNALIYGVGIVDANMAIGGTSSAPDVSGNVTLDNKSDVHYVLPAKNNYKDDLKQVVKFINVDTIQSFNNRNIIFTSAADTVAKISYKGLKYNLNLEVQEAANITVLIDPSSGDELTIKGKAQLNAGVDENGIIGLTGVYQLKEGAYNLSYQFVKKRFNLVEGSTITFSGNPMEAVADITAEYEVETSPKELLGNEITENSSALGTAYNKKVPFDVILKIKGALTKPELSFDIKVKDGADGVNTTLGTTIDNKLAQYRNDASEMNKQVFALLIMGRFIGDRSSDFFATSSSGGTSTTDLAKQSVSKFLAEAVNQIASDLIKGVDINLDLKNYEGDAATNTATRTDLNVELSKQLLNDRLIVTVGKSFTIDGDDPLAKTQGNSNLQFLPDVTTTYKLSKDGRYALRAYRKNQYEAILDGYFTETGVAFTLTVNYEKLKEIFQKRRRNINKQSTK